LHLLSHTTMHESMNIKLKNVFIIIYGRIKFANVHATKAYREVELYLHLFLTSTLEVWKSIMLRDRGFGKLL
jgi:hypothetical protein